MMSSSLSFHVNRYKDRKTRSYAAFCRMAQTERTIVDDGVEPEICAPSCTKSCVIHSYVTVL